MEEWTFVARLVNGTQIIFGDGKRMCGDRGEDSVMFRNPMTMMMVPAGPGMPPQAAIVPVIPGDIKNEENFVTYREAYCAVVEGSVLDALEKNYRMATSRLDLSPQRRM